jgi:hypothetical protein
MERWLEDPSGREEAYLDIMLEVFARRKGSRVDVTQRWRVTRLRPAPQPRESMVSN